MLVFEVLTFSFFALAAARAAKAAVVATGVVTAVAGASQPPPSPPQALSPADAPLLALAAAAASSTSEQRSSQDGPVCMRSPPRLPAPLLFGALLLGGVAVVASGVVGFTGGFFAGDITTDDGVTGADAG